MAGHAPTDPPPLWPRNSLSLVGEDTSQPRGRMFAWGMNGQPVPARTVRATGLPGLRDRPFTGSREAPLSTSTENMATFANRQRGHGAWLYCSRFCGLSRSWSRLLLPVRLMTSAWWTILSIMAEAIVASPNTSAQRLKARLLVRISEARS